MKRKGITPEMRAACETFDGIFTILSIIFAVVAMVHLIGGNTDRFVSRLTLALVLWIASTQLAPYWNKDAPERCRCQEGDR